MTFDVFDWNHIDAAHELTFFVIRQKGPGWKRIRFHIKLTETGNKVRKRHEFAHLFVAAAGGRLREITAASKRRRSQSDAKSRRLLCYEAYLSQLQCPEAVAHE